MLYLTALEDSLPSIKITRLEPTTSTIAQETQCALYLIDTRGSVPMGSSHHHLRRHAHITVTCQTVEKDLLTIAVLTTSAAISSNIPQTITTAMRNSPITPLGHQSDHIILPHSPMPGNLRCDFQHDHMMRTIVTVRHHP